MKSSRCFGAVLASLFASFFAGCGQEAPIATSLATEDSSSPGSTELIIGGNPASPGEYPFMVGVLDQDNPDNFQAQFCAGTVINSTTVLSAAHCFSTPLPPVDILVGTNSLDGSGTRIPVLTIKIHPDYNQAGPEDSDLALLTLAQPVGVPPVALVSSADPISAGTLATIIGWGATRPLSSVFPEDLLEASVPIREGPICDNASPIPLTDNMICA